MFTFTDTRCYKNTTWYLITFIDRLIGFCSLVIFSLMELMMLDCVLCRAIIYIILHEHINETHFENTLEIFFWYLLNTKYFL